MKQTAEIDFYRKLIAEKQEALNLALKEFFGTIYGDNTLGKQNKASRLVTAADELIAVLPKDEVPGWLQGIRRIADRYCAGDFSSSFLTALFESFSALNNHRWKFDGEQSDGFNFDAIFEKYRDESRLEELFDGVIKILEDIEKSGEIDKLSMITALEKLILTLKRNKKGSFFSINSAWQFLLNFLKNYLFAELSQIPALASAVEALKVTISEINTEMFQVSQKVETEMSSKVEAGVKQLAGKSSIHAQLYNEAGLLSDLSGSGSAVRESA